MSQPIFIADYLASAEMLPVIDVRTPAEFEKGHIPGAFNVPLFSNEERVAVGTTYKQQSREAAILLGFDLAGPKWSGFIKDCLSIAPQKRVVVHCWRGGMRSGAMAWALNLYGFKVFVIKGGYKQYRAWVRNHFEKKYHLSILGGMTGSGKTALLQQLQQSDEQVIDLEKLAQHRGSAYGSMNYLKQPTQEQFENNLAMQLYKKDTAKKIWMEDECQMIGRCCIPPALWHQMRTTALIDLQVPYDARVHYLCDEYGVLDKTFLEESTLRISKRLGPKETKDAIAAIKENRMADFIKIVLVYYDKQYRKGLSKRLPEKIVTVQAGGVNAVENATILLQEEVTSYPKDATSSCAQKNDDGI
ncbi:MAG: tRNA 2-selenouridine(34) synthase MnmH [Ferruginibacter sp.]